MKKLSLIVAMAVVLTIGGVFATWNYVDTTAYTATEGVTIGIAGTGTLGDSGSLQAAVSGFQIIPTAENGSNYTAILSADSKVTLTFTPSLGSKYNDGTPLKIKYTVTVDDNPTVDIGGGSKDIFVVTTKTDVETTFAATTGQSPVTIELSASDLGIALNTFVLDTSAKYTTFKNALGEGQLFTVTITEVAA